MKIGQDGENRQLNASERELVKGSQPSEASKLPEPMLKSLLQRLRTAWERARGNAAHQQREMRGKAEPRGVRPVQENAGTVAKADILRSALDRVEGELGQRRAEETVIHKPTELASHLLEMKLQGGSPVHQPKAGPPNSKGMNSKERQKPPKIGTTRREMGRVSQAGKVSQARRDSKPK